MLRVDFKERSVRKARGITESNYYSMVAPSWEIARVLDGKLTWEDFSLTFRMRLSREPDVYQTLIQGFLIMEPEDLDHLCARILDIESKQERIVVEAGGCRSCARDTRGMRDRYWIRNWRPRSPAGEALRRERPRPGR
jgi:UDP-MurNAc hydroxylase